MRTRYEHTCQLCKRTFTSTNKEQSYCTTACYHASRGNSQIEKVCPVCGNVFWVYPSHNYQVHCSTACVYDGMQELEEHKEAVFELHKAAHPEPEVKEERFKPFMTRRCHKCKNKFRQKVYEKPQDFCENCR